MKTLAEMFPGAHWATDPKYAELAARPFEFSAPAGPWNPRVPGRVAVGFLAPCLAQGGAEAWQLLLARSLDPEAFTIAGVAVAGQPVDPAARSAYAGVCPVAIGAPAARSLAASCDVLVAWGRHDLGAILAGLDPRPAVLSVAHLPPESRQDWWTGVPGLGRVAAVSRSARESVPAAIRGPVRVIANAVDPARLEARRSRAEMRARWGVPGDAPVAGYLGRLAPEKDPGAMARLADALPDPWRVVVVGDGESRRALAPRPRLRVVGPDPAAGDVLGGFDVLVVPSRFESFGLTIAEGLWSGVPVVSTPVGIAAEHPGLTHPVPVGADGPALAAAVTAAFASGPRPGSRDLARARFGPERFARDWGRLVRSTAGLPADPGPNPHEARRLLMLGCDYRGGPVGCGCNRSVVCLMGKGWPIAGSDAREVFAADCLACVAGP